VTRIPAFAPFGRRDAERSDILHCLTRISRKRGFDPGRVSDFGGTNNSSIRSWTGAGRYQTLRESIYQGDPRGSCARQRSSSKMRKPREGIVGVKQHFGCLIFSGQCSSLYSHRLMKVEPARPLQTDTIQPVSGINQRQAPVTFRPRAMAVGHPAENYQAAAMTRYLTVQGVFHEIRRVSGSRS
jgi:hypothetical protein